MVTTQCGLHSPEIAHLENGQNGIITPDSLDAYVTAVVRLLNDDAEVSLLRTGCGRSASRYTVNNMAGNFADGIVGCLKAPFYRSH